MNGNDSGGAGMAIHAHITLTPEQVAAAYWNLGSDEQADFFAELNRIAGYKLCLQTAAVVREIAHRSERGEHDALLGFQTLLAHSQEYHEAAAEMRAAYALRALRREFPEIFA